MRLLGRDLHLVPRRTFADLFRSVDEGVADLIIAPVENTISGVVEPARQLIQASDLSLLAEISIPVIQNLIACRGTRLGDIRTVQSHPVALAQCTRFFAKHPQMVPVVADDTAGSVAEVIKRCDPTYAAIAGKRAAETYGGTILKEKIQDSENNFTRFVLLAPAAVRDTSSQIIPKEVHGHDR